MKSNHKTPFFAAAMLLAASIHSYAQDSAESNSSQEPASGEEVVKPDSDAESSTRLRDRLREDIAHRGENPHSRLPYKATNPDALSAAEAKERHESNELLPFFRERAVENGTVLPWPHGLSVVATHYVEDLELEKLTIKRDGKPNITTKDESILQPKDLSLYNVSFRVDAWIFPYVNVYALVGRTQVDFDLEVDIDVEIDGIPINYQNTFDFEAGRNSYTVGTILGYGRGNWFGMVDLRYAQTDFSLSTTGPQTYTTIVRAGWNGRIGRLKGMVWAGALKQEVDFALTTNSEEVSAIPDFLDVTEIDIRFGSRHGYTPMIGSRWDMDSHWSLAVEYSFLDREYFNAVMMFRY